MNDQRQRLVENVQAYLDRHENSSVKVTTTIRGYLELSTVQIRALLDALCQYQSPDEQKMELRDELLETFYRPPKS